MKISKEALVHQYEISGQIMYDATLSGDYRANNREGKKLLKLFQMMEKDTALADACIPLLLESKNVVVRTTGASYYLSLKRNTDTAEQVLQEISDNEEYGIFAFNAKMTLNVWHENGELPLYQRK